ncbi:hypothetical protein [Aurantimonas sp. A3-2-R12]|uniref:hypothetical protein n=1 Tax=Aurantimonas sp. A3-2-R12 TaxID=3114362 RepID=UPI002E170B31|nr:hypothetical protein [Aurantimonas sp. A3-2-R12]
MLFFLASVTGIIQEIVANRNMQALASMIERAYTLSGTHQIMEETMRNSGAAALAATGVVFAIFVANVVLGAMAGKAFLSDVGEMLVLSLASILFVIAVLHRERAREGRSDVPNIDNGREEATNVQDS